MKHQLPDFYYQITYIHTKFELQIVSESLSSEV
jgi:hypothetical protein